MMHSFHSPESEIACEEMFKMSENVTLVHKMFSVHEIFTPINIKHFNPFTWYVHHGNNILLDQTYSCKPVIFRAAVRAAVIEDFFF